MFGATDGLEYGVWSSDQVNWIAQDNAIYLEDYYQDLEQLYVPEQILAILHRLVDEQPGITLADLREAAEGIPADLINIAIAKHDLSVDLGCYCKFWNSMSGICTIMRAGSDVPFA